MSTVVVVNVTHYDVLIYTLNLAVFTKPVNQHSENSQVQSWRCFFVRIKYALTEETA